MFTHSPFGSDIICYTYEESMFTEAAIKLLFTFDLHSFAPAKKIY